MKFSKIVWIVFYILLIAILLVILWKYQYQYQEGLTNSNILKNFYSVTKGSPPIETYVGEYTILTFNSSCTFTLPSNIQPLQIGYVVVGGGSGCGYGNDGFNGGGGGGICYTPLAQSTTKMQSETSYTIQVGSGGLNPVLAGVVDIKTDKRTNSNMPQIYGLPSSISGSNINPTIIANGGCVSAYWSETYPPSIAKPSGGIFNLSGGIGDTFYNTTSVVNGAWTNTPKIINRLKDGPLISIPEINLKQNFGGGGGSGYTIGDSIGSNGGVGGGGTGNTTITDQTKIDGQPNSGGGGGGYLKINKDSKGYTTSTTLGWGSGGSGIVIIYFTSPIAAADKAFTVGSKIADEGGNFYLDSTTEVRYGYDNRWNYKTLAKGNYTADNDLFGDPAPGAVKIVQKISRQDEIDKAAADKAAADKVAADKVAAEKVAADKVAADKVAADKVASDKVAADKVAADKVAADKVASDKVGADKVAADKVAADKVAVAEAVAVAQQEQQLEDALQEQKTIIKPSSIYSIPFSESFGLYY